VRAPSSVNVVGADLAIGPVVQADPVARAPAARLGREAARGSGAHKGSEFGQHYHVYDGIQASFKLRHRDERVETATAFPTAPNMVDLPLIPILGPFGAISSLSHWAQVSLPR
jgi:hypothetical protein